MIASRNFFTALIHERKRERGKVGESKQNGSQKAGFEFAESIKFRSSNTIEVESPRYATRTSFRKPRKFTNVRFGTLEISRAREKRTSNNNLKKERKREKIFDRIRIGKRWRISSLLKEREYF